MKAAQSSEQLPHIHRLQAQPYVSHADQAEAIKPTPAPQLDHACPDPNLYITAGKGPV